MSDDAEALILVDAADQPVGRLDKFACHAGGGVLHRAFSLFIFDPAGRLLLQQRAANKRLWPNYWSNSCCSHPRWGETLDIAVQRRCQQELGFVTPLEFVYKFQYAARYGDEGGENELCSVFIGRYAGVPRINSTEIQDWEWLSPEQLDARLAAQPTTFTPWFKLEWERLRTEFADSLPQSLPNRAGRPLRSR